MKQRNRYFDAGYFIFVDTRQGFSWHSECHTSLTKEDVDFYLDVISVVRQDWNTTEEMYQFEINKHVDRCFKKHVELVSPWIRNWITEIFDEPIDALDEDYDEDDQAEEYYSRRLLLLTYISGDVLPMYNGFLPTVFNVDIYYTPAEITDVTSQFN
jgi:hypothetical protein